MGLLELHCTPLCEKGIKQWNVSPLIRRGCNFYFFAALYSALLDLLPCLQAGGTRDCDKGSNGNLIYLRFFLGGKVLVNKLWFLLYKRAELDLRLTKPK